jgi:RNA polymerase sigma-70 factor (ECF subfamily)
MLTQLTKGSAVAADGRDLGSVVLADTQAYLEARCQGMTPGPHLAKAWERFYLTCAPLIERCVAAYPMSEEDHCDCVQEIWKEIIVGLHRFQYDPRRGKLRTWLYSMARNKAVDVNRGRRRHPIGSLGEEVEKSLPGHDPDPAAEFERQQTQAAVWNALDRLSREASSRSYQVLYLRWIEGRTVPEIAMALGLTPEQVHFRHHRVMRKFRRLMEFSDGNIASESERGQIS